MTASLHRITCPSGLQILARPIGSEELIAIAERQKPNGTDTEAIGLVWQNCVREIEDPGPYSFVEPGTAKPAWTRLLWGDVLVVILRLRAISFPRLKGSYDFDVPCTSCGTLTPWTVSIDDLFTSDLYRPLSTEARERIAEGAPLETTISRLGTRVWYDLQRASQEKPMRDLLRREGRKKETDVELIAKQLVRIEGLNDKKSGTPIIDLRALWIWCKQNLILDDIDELLSTFRRSDCGVELEMRIRCEGTDSTPGCGRQFDAQLPLGRTFFAPRNATKTASTERRGSGESSSPTSPPNGSAPTSERSSGTPTEEAATPVSATATSSG